MAPAETATKRLSNLDLLDECDALPYADRRPELSAAWNDSLYTLIYRDGQGTIPLGYMLKLVVEKLLEVPISIRGEVEVDAENKTILAFNQPTEPERTKTLGALTAFWRDQEEFLILKGWRDELWPVYGRGNELLYSIERSATGLLGVIRYGVHMTAYVKDESARYGLKIWVPTRAANKSTYPNMLDNTVAGGLMTEEEPFECIVREADEEAALPENFMRKNAEPVGKVTWIYITGERSGGEAGFIYPECEWLYDLELPVDIIPEPKDGEAQDFRLCTIEEVQENLARGRFKPNCAVVLLDFFIRHGILTPQNEPYYDEIVRRVHRKLPFPGPWAS